ncbi:MAG: MBL fold metallo-hydrolase [Halanaerobiales bacterium]|nr:MBL fold metallo-hydrolase [Halanaerobiales bacterium]
MSYESNWFTVEKIDDTTFAISEYGHWEKVHSYLLIGSESACLIDTGLGIGNIKKVVDGLTNLPIKVLTTHVHWDHIGGHGFYDNIYVHKADADWLTKGIPIPLENIRKNVVKEPISKPFPKGFDISIYYPFTGKPNVELSGGECIELGNRKLRIIHTPGHSPGHICVFEEEKGYLYSGDIFYIGILYAFYPSTDPVKFAESIKKLSQLNNVSRILPGHNDLNVSSKLLEKANLCFQALGEKGLLYHGSGLHDCGCFKIQL